GRIELTASVAQPTDPATDPAWNGGHSYVMWGLDTTADGTADYLVMMASGPPLAAAVFSNQLATVDACNPVADYTPARYSVTFPASCIGSPATFGWNSVVYYDANHSDDGTGAMDSIVGQNEVTLAPGTKSDPTGDVFHHRRDHRLRTGTDRRHRHPRPADRPASRSQLGDRVDGTRLVFRHRRQ
ncbi:MAG: hypothetical protein LC792_14925, partial [Actinobacteria bacterium]|nr:hypothetical protein [Actinomycetota bacterium]